MLLLLGCPGAELNDIFVLVRLGDLLKGDFLVERFNKEFEGASEIQRKGPLEHSHDGLVAFIGRETVGESAHVVYKDLIQVCAEGGLGLETL